MTRSDRSRPTPPSPAREVEIRLRHVAFAIVPFIAILAGVWIGSGRAAFVSPLAGPDEGSSLWLIFFTGLSIGGLSCLAVQGGLLTATLMRREQRSQDSLAMPGMGERLGPVVQFLTAKVIAYTILGAILGYFGSKIPTHVQGWLLIAVGVFMLIVVLQMFDVHPIFRRISFQPPKRIQRLIRAESKKGSPAGPAILGAMTVLIPCGVTIAVEGLAMASESPLRGALIMLTFTLGTVPLFLLLGFVATNLNRGSYRLFRPLAALIVVIISGYSILGGMRLLGVATGIGSADGEIGQASMITAEDQGSLQAATIRVGATSYAPETVRLQAGIPTRLSMVTENNTGCTRTFTIPSLGVDVILPVSGTQILDLPPINPGRVVFTCGMGMYSGVLDVVAAVSPVGGTDS